MTAGANDDELAVDVHKQAVAAGKRTHGYVLLTVFFG